MHCQLTVMAPKGSSKAMGKARGNMPTSVINRRLSLDWDHNKGSIFDYILGLIRIYNVCGFNNQRVGTSLII